MSDRFVPYSVKFSNELNSETLKELRQLEAYFEVLLIEIDAAIQSLYAFGVVSVAGQSDVVADHVFDTLTLVAGSGITLTTNATNDSVTITAASASGVSPPDKSIQFNEAGAFGGDAEFIYDTIEHTVTLQPAMVTGGAGFQAAIYVPSGTFDPSTNAAGQTTAVLIGQLTVPNTTTHNRAGVNGLYLDIEDAGNTGTAQLLYGTEVYVEASGSSNVTGGITGAYANAARSGSGTSSSIDGGIFEAFHNGSGAVTGMTGLGGFVEAPHSGAGTVGTMFGLDIEAKGQQRTTNVYGQFVLAEQANAELFGALTQVTQASNLSGTMRGARWELDAGTGTVAITGGIYGLDLSLNDRSNSNNTLIGANINVGKSAGSGVPPNVYGLIVDATDGAAVNQILMTADHNPAADGYTLLGLYDNSTIVFGNTHSVDKFASIYANPTFLGDGDSVNYVGGVVADVRMNGDGDHPYVFGGEFGVGTDSGVSGAYAFMSAVGGYAYHQGSGQIDEMWGAWWQVQNQDVATVVIAGGHLIYAAENSGGGAITTLYGLKIEDQNVGGTNYAIHTGAGLSQFGDAIRLAATTTVAGLPAAALGKLAVVSDALAPAWGVAVAGTGAAKALVWYNGAAWTVVGA